MARGSTSTVLTPVKLQGRAAPKRKPSDQPASPIGVWKGTKQVTVTYEESVAAEKALKHPIIFRCLHKLATSAASVSWYCEKDADLPAADQAGTREIKAVNDLLQSPSDVWTRSQMVYWMALNLAAYGRIPFKVGLSSVEPHLPTGIYPLTARFVQAVRDDRGLVTSYTYGEGKANSELPTRKKAATGKSYIHEIVRPNLDGTFESKNNVHPLGAIGLPAQIVTLLLRRAADTASGHPNTKYIVVCEKTLTAKQKKALDDQINNNMLVDAEQSGQVLFLYNTDVAVHKLDNDLNDIHSKMPLDDMSRMIIGAFGIPIALMGMSASDAAKFAGNYSESRLSFWLDTIIPEYLDPIAIGLTAAVCPPGARIRFDYDSVPAIVDMRVGYMEKLGKLTFLTKNEKRSIVGFEPLSEEKGGEDFDAPVQAQPRSPSNANPEAKPEQEALQ